MYNPHQHPPPGHYPGQQYQPQPHPPGHPDHDPQARQQPPPPGGPGHPPPPHQQQPYQHQAPPPQGVPPHPEQDQDLVYTPRQQQGMYEQYPQQHHDGTAGYHHHHHQPHPPHGVPPPPGLPQLPPLAVPQVGQPGSGGPDGVIGQDGGVEGGGEAAVGSSIASAVYGKEAGGMPTQLYVCPQCTKTLKSQAGLTSHLQHCDPDKIAIEKRRNPQEKALKINSKRREQWEIKFEELKAYKAQHRHCRVPAVYGKEKGGTGLGRWVSASRREYRKRQAGQKNQLTDERVLKLVSIGFDFSVHGSNWDTKYAELMDFAAKNGHSEIPIRYKPNQPLSIWAHRQRAAYRDRKDGKRSAMSDERIAAMEAIGFKWSVGKPLTKGKHIPWDERIQQLQEFIDKHGHARVQRKPDEDPEQGLANWVAMIRNNAKRGVGSLTPERKAQLDGMGFLWSLRKEYRTDSKSARDGEKKRKRGEDGKKKKKKKKKSKKGGDDDGDDNDEPLIKRKPGRPRKDAAAANEKDPRGRKPRSTLIPEEARAAMTLVAGGGRGPMVPPPLPIGIGTNSPPPGTVVPPIPATGGTPILPTFPPSGWGTGRKGREGRIGDAKRAVAYYAAVTKEWETIVKREEAEGEKDREEEEAEAAAAALAAVVTQEGGSEISSAKENDTVAPGDGATAAGDEVEFHDAVTGVANDENEISV